MSTITKDVTTEHHDRRFEDRLLDALLVEFDAPSEVRESAGVTPARRPRREWVGAWLAAAAVVALLGGATWMFTGGLDSDESRVTVAGAPTTVVPDPPFLTFADSDGVVRSELWSKSPAEDRLDGEIVVPFRPVEGGRDRPVLTVSTRFDAWHAGSGNSKVTPGGITVFGNPSWSDPSGPWTFATWETADGTVLWVTQEVMSMTSYHSLDLLTTDELLAFVDSLRFDGTRFETADPAYERMSVDDPNSRAGGPYALWSIDAPTPEPTSTTAERNSLTAFSGPIDLDATAGTEVEVRGTRGVYGRYDGVQDEMATLTWNEDGVAVKLEFNGGADHAPSADDMVAAADALRRIDRSTFEAIPLNPNFMSADDAELLLRFVRIAVPETRMYDLRVHQLHFDAAGASLNVSAAASNGTTYGGSPSRYLDLPVPPGTAEMVVWLGLSEEPPACAQRIDVTDAEPKVPVATLDLSCTS